jgi:hypothetical protein
MPRAPTNANNQVTHAVLGEKLDNLGKAVKVIVEDRAHHDEKIDVCIKLLEQMVAVHTEQIKELNDRVHSLDGQVKTWSLANTVGVIVAGVLGYFGIQR